MRELPESIDSRFRYVLIASKRAEQLIQGSLAKTRSRHNKPTRVAMDEVDAGLINWTEAPEEAPANLLDSLES